MHRKGSIYILEISSTRRHLRSVEPGLPWQRYNPTQRRRPLETAKSASWCPESEIIPFMCCNWFSVGAIKNWWWKGRELRTETQVLCVCVCVGGGLVWKGSRRKRWSGLIAVLCGQVATRALCTSCPGIHHRGHGATPGSVFTSGRKINIRTPARIPWAQKCEPIECHCGVGTLAGLFTVVWVFFSTFAKGYFSTPECPVAMA